MSILVGSRILVGTSIGILFGLLSPAGIACLQHLTLRLILEGATKALERLLYKV
jgi:hypothetical protein